ncbi:unnamed protein product [Protopolystoma xenopodis]|uniref:Uncharacterized protein n=1 Tax=Protopolystoma xenopodis TaxID=117903 RepID=A0A448XQ33_9PLAT|nr:unnamed protein product [Protopolystoma xenopodis]
MRTGQTSVLAVFLRAIHPPTTSTVGEVAFHAGQTVLRSVGCFRASPPHLRLRLRLPSSHVFLSRLLGGGELDGPMIRDDRLKAGLVQRLPKPASQPRSEVLFYSNFGALQLSRQGQLALLSIASRQTQSGKFCESLWDRK